MAKKNGKTILVTGATGKQGGAALRRLRERGFEVRAFTRDPNKLEARSLVGQGTEVVRGDLNDPASIARALEGVDGVYSVQDSRQGGEEEIRQGLALADAAKKTRIRQFVYSSVVAAEQKTGIPHFESKWRIEEHIRGTGLAYTIFRPVFFMENWFMFRGGVDQGAIALPLSPETRLQLIAVDDIGAFVAMAFEKPGHWQGRAFELAGDELSMAQLAQAFTRISGHEVRYQQVPWDEFEKQAGPEMTTMWRWFESNGYHVDISAVRQEYPNLTSFERWVQSKWLRRQTA